MSEKYSPASLAYVLVADRSLMLSIFPIPLKRISQARFLRKVKPLTLPLDSPVHAPIPFIKQGFCLSFLFPPQILCPNIYWGDSLRGFCLI